MSGTLLFSTERLTVQVEENMSAKNAGSMRWPGQGGPSHCLNDSFQNGAELFRIRNACKTLQDRDSPKIPLGWQYDSTYAVACNMNIAP